MTLRQSSPPAVAPEPVDPITVTDEPLIPHGVLASVTIIATPFGADGSQHSDDTRALHHAERALVATLPAPQRSNFVAGRRVLRAALQRVAPEHAVTPLLRTSRGAPLLPQGLTGSVSHKRSRAIAMVAPSSGEVIGVDLEERPNEADVARRSIAERILTGRELERLADLQPLAHREATLVHFALKEAVYKAIDPYVERYVHFTEVELEVRDDGSALVRLLLPESSVGDVCVEAHWRLEGPWIVAMARSHQP